MTVCADPIDAKQRIKLNRAPQNQNEEALKDELKRNGLHLVWLRRERQVDRRQNVR